MLVELTSDDHDVLGTSIKLRITAAERGGMALRRKRKRRKKIDDHDFLVIAPVSCFSSLFKRDRFAVI